MRHQSTIILLGIVLIGAQWVSCARTPGDAEPWPDKQAVSLLGEDLFSSEPSAEARQKFEEAKSRYEQDPGDIDAIIWYGRRAAYMGDYRQALAIYTLGIERFPDEARLYRHRGHRYISVREFDRAIEDLEAAAGLVTGMDDVIEPDGMPNDRNIPVSSLHTNIWYHLGLAHYLKNDLESALRAYRKGIDASRNDDMRVAFSHWLYMTLRLLDRAPEAAEALDPIHSGMNIIENTAYHRLCLFYKGELTLEDHTDAEFSPTMNDAVAYGIACWHLYNGDRGRAKDLYEEILARDSWASFGHIAAEADYARIFR